MGLTEAYLNGTPGPPDLRPKPVAEGRITLTVVEANRGIIRSGCSSEWALPSNRNGIHCLRVSNDISRRRTSVEHECVAESSLYCTLADLKRAP